MLVPLDEFPKMAFRMVIGAIIDQVDAIGRVGIPRNTLQTHLDVMQFVVDGDDDIAGSVLRAGVPSPDSLASPALNRYVESFI